MKPGANDPCHCGSGRKYKRCCRRKDQAQAPQRTTTKLTWNTLQQTPLEQLLAHANTFLQQRKLSPNSPDSWLGLAEMASETNDTSRMKIFLQEAETLAKDEETWFSLATFWSHAHEYQRAWKLLQQHTSPQTPPVSAQIYWKCWSDLAWRNENWDALLQGIQQLPSHRLDLQTRWRRIFALSQCQYRDQLAEQTQRDAEQTQHTIWHILHANAAQVWGETTTANELYTAYLADTIEQIHHTKYNAPLEKAILHAVQTIATQWRPSLVEAILDLLLQQPFQHPQHITEQIQLALEWERWQGMEICATAWLQQQPASTHAKLYQQLARWMQHKSTHELERIPLAQLTKRHFPPQLWLHIGPFFLQRDGSNAFWNQWRHIEQSLPAEQHIHLQTVRILLLLQEGNPQQAITELQQSNLSLPLSMLLGYAYLQDKQPQQAIAQLEALLPQLPTSWQNQSRLWLAQATLQRQQYDRSNDWLTQYAHDTTHPIRSSPDYWSLKYQYAESIGDTEQMTEALQTLYQCTQDPHELERLCAHLLQHKQTPKILHYLDPLDPSDDLPPSLLLLGVHLYAQQQEWNQLLRYAKPLAAQRPLNDVVWFSTQLAQINAHLQLQQPWLALAHTEATETSLHLQTSLQPIERTDIFGTLLLSYLDNEDPTTSIQQTLHTQRRQATQQLLQHPTQPPSPMLQDLLTNRTQPNQPKERSPQPNTPLHPTRRQTSPTTSLWRTLQNHRTPPQTDRLSEPSKLLEQLSAASPEQQETLLHTHLPTQSNTQPPTQLEQIWGHHSWLRLPLQTRKCLLAAEELLVLFATVPHQDHAPILLQWARAAEESLNRRLVDTLAQLASKTLGLRLHRDLPTLGGKPLRKPPNQISIGSVPYLLSEAWEIPNASNTRYAYNPQITAEQRLLWESFKHKLRTVGLSESIIAFLFDEIPSLCSRWGTLRNQAAHNAQAFSRDTIIQLRKELLLQTPNLFTITAQIPPNLHL